MLTADNIHIQIRLMRVVDALLFEKCQAASTTFSNTGQQEELSGSMAPSEIVTICLIFRFSGIVILKRYCRFLETYYRHYFPKLSGKPFVYLKKQSGNQASLSFYNELNGRGYRHSFY